MGVGIFGLLFLLVGLVLLVGLGFALVWFVKGAGSIRPGHAMLGLPAVFRRDAGQSGNVPEVRARAAVMVRATKP